MRPLRIALAVALLATASLYALDVPPAPTEWVTDKAGVLDASAASALNEKLRSFEQESGAQFIIYILPSTQGDPVEDFTIRCAAKWKVGNKKYDNGLILFVFPQDRKARIEVGYGLEGTVTDAYSSRVIRDDLAPHFQRNDYAGGLNAAADDLIAKIKGGEPAHPEASQTRTPPRQSTSNSVAGLPCNLLFLFAIIFAIFILPQLFFGRSRRRSGCGGCFWPMFFFPGGGGGITFGGGGGGWGGGGGFGGGGFSGGGGGFGGGGATGGW